MMEEIFITEWKSFREIENSTLVFANRLYDEHEKILRETITNNYQDWKAELTVSVVGESCDQKCVLH